MFFLYLMDSPDARAFLFEKMNRTDDAVSMWECIIQTLGRDYSISSGESVDWAQREIARLKSLI